jgi:hypothetical protein
MGQRTLEQRLLGELVADLSLKNAPILGLSAHRTIVNSRLHRTENGQRQISQARSPS